MAQQVLFINQSGFFASLLCRAASGWLLWLALLLAGSAWAGPAPGDGGSAPSLAQALNPDGTLRADAQGSFDARSFVLQTAPDGRPSFSPAHTQGPGDENWQDGFGLAGADGPVYAIAQIGTSLYIGGDFKTVGTVLANNIAKWDGIRWSSLGTGPGGRSSNVSTWVRALAVIGTTLYVGGDFTSMNGVPANGIAKWDGNSWSALSAGSAPPLANGVDGRVGCLAVSGTSLYVGGMFYTAGNVAANCVARWDGTRWSSLGRGSTNGTNGPVQALAVFENNLYVGGQFGSAGDQVANRVAKWDGISWSSLGTGTANGVGSLNGFAYAVMTLAVAGNTLYVGGSFTSAGGAAANQVAKWDGTSWSSLGTGLADYPVYALAVVGTDVYAGGLFAAAGGQVANHIAKWDGAGWSSLPGGVSAPVQALLLVGTHLYVGGDFGRVGSIVANRIAAWDGTSWSSLGTGNGLIGNVYVVCASGNNVYVGGTFTYSGGAPGDYIAKWDGTSWSGLGTGAAGGLKGGPVTAIAVSGNNVYAGGNFTWAGSQRVNQVARWDGTSWSAMGSGVPPPQGVSNVTSLAAIGSDVYVGGWFTTVGGVAVRGIARWDGSSWHSLDQRVGGWVSCLVVVGTSLYVGGGFSSTDGTPLNGVVRWDGTNWSTLGPIPGVSGTARRVAVSGSLIYASGSYVAASGVTRSWVACWDGSTWSSMGSVLGVIYGLAASGTKVYAGNDYSPYIRRWDGTNWVPAGTGLNGAVEDLAAGPGDQLYVGGGFAAVGDSSKVVSCFGLYHTGQATPLATASPALAAASVYPNPAQGSFVVQVPAVAGASTVQAELLNNLGQVVRQLTVALPVSGTRLVVPATGLAPGSYLLRLRAGAATSTQHVVVQ